MTDIEQKAQAVVGGVLEERGIRGFCIVNRQTGAVEEALCRAIEQHEAAKQELADFKQKVSDAVAEYKADQPHIWQQSASGYFAQFIISKPKPDPLVQAMEEVDICAYAEIKAEYADSLRADLVDRFRAALDALGFEIRKKGQ